MRRKNIDAMEEQRFFRKQALALIRALSGERAENLARDMDHKQKDHSKWYADVEKARRWLNRQAKQ